MREQHPWIAALTYPSAMNEPARPPPVVACEPARPRGIPHGPPRGIPHGLLSPPQVSTLRMLVLGALRYGKPLVLDFLALDLTEDSLRQMLDPVMPRLVQLLISKQVRNGCAANERPASWRAPLKVARHLPLSLSWRPGPSHAASISGPLLPLPPHLAVSAFRTRHLLFLSPHCPPPPPPPPPPYPRSPPNTPCADHAGGELHAPSLPLRPRRVRGHPLA